MNKISKVDMLAILAVVAINGAIGALIGHRTFGNAAIGASVGITASSFGWLILMLGSKKTTNKRKPSVGDMNSKNAPTIYVIEDKERSARKRDIAILQNC
jgi:hypothetical protein